MTTRKNAIPLLRTAALAAAVAFGAPTESWATAHKCAIRLGAGCNGPVVYEIQLCSKVSANGGKCARLCESLKPVCNVADFDAWVSAYNSGGFLSGRLGKNGFKGDLAQATNTENYDNDGQLALTSGNTYTVCMTSAKALQSFHDNHPVSASVACPKVKVASATTCTGGTVFNNDPVNPRCVTSDSYCSNTVASGNFVSTMSAGFQMVAVQNLHFVSAPEQDPNLHGSAATAGTDVPGLQAPTNAAATDGGVNAATFGSQNGRTGVSGSSYGAGAGGMGALASTGGATGGTLGKDAVTDDSAFASKTFAMEGSGYKNGGAGGAIGGSGGAGGLGGGGAGPSWFGSGGSASAGGASAELAIEGGAGRGLASDGRLVVEDPENYFLLSDVDVSLFKRVTAQCRKKERSLVLAPIPVSAKAAIPHNSAN